MRCALVLALALLGSESCTAADLPPVGRIVVFGDLRLEAAVRKLLPPIPISLGENDGDKLRETLAMSRLWRQSDLTWVCCEPAGTAILYVGVKATDRRPHLRPTPAGAVRLDREDLSLYHRLMDRVQEAAATGQSAEDDSAGHALSGYPPERKLQQEIIARAGGQVAHWREVALTSSKADDRAAAVHLIPYGPKDQALADVLMSAVRDPSALVRNNAVRAIGVLARSTATRSRLRFDPQPLLDLFESVHWTDWNKASYALLALIETGDAKLLAEVAKRARQPLRQIANWPPMHAGPGIAILERIGRANTR